jgi:hypothetical protein
MSTYLFAKEESLVCADNYILLMIFIITVRFIVTVIYGPSHHDKLPFFPVLLSKRLRLSNRSSLTSRQVPLSWRLNRIEQVPLSQEVVASFVICLHCRCIGLFVL